MKKRIFTVFMSSVLLLAVCCIPVLAGYKSGGFGEANNCNATLTATMTDVSATTSGPYTTKITNVYGTTSNGATRSGGGSVSASAGRVGSEIFLSADSVHWCGNYCRTLYTNV